MIQWSEQDLEDWLCSSAEEGGSWRLWEVLGDLVPQQGRPIRAARQVPLGDMIADIIIAWPDYLAVIELKCNAATGDDLAQVLHYEYWLAERCWHSHFAMERGGNAPDVLAYLIAPSFSERIQVAAQSTRVRLCKVELVWTISDVKWGEPASIDSAYDDEASCDKYIKFALGTDEEAAADESEAIERVVEAIEQE